jgi:hypothetical protein
MHPAGQRGIKLRGCGAAVSMGRRVCGNDFVMLKKRMLYISSCPTCPSTRGWTNRWEGKDKHWETLRFSLFFWSSPKTKIRKKQKTSKANFQCSKCCLFFAVVFANYGNCRCRQWGPYDAIAGLRFWAVYPMTKTVNSQPIKCICIEIVVAGSEGRMMRSQGYGSGLCIPWQKQ